jgi:hypothetical protein
MDKKLYDHIDCPNNLVAVEDDRESYWKNAIVSLKKKHTGEITNLITNFNATTASASIEHAKKLEAQKAIDALTNACIQDELDAERAEHEVTQRTLKEKSVDDGTLILTQHQLKTEEAAHAATKLELHAVKTELSIFNGIDSTKALADHITGMQVFIDKWKQRMERENGTLEERTELQLKDMEDTLLLKTPTNYKFLFMSEVAYRMGYTFTTKELKVIGYQIAIEYKGMTGSTPNKHMQLVEGPVISPNLSLRMSTKNCLNRSCHCCEHVHRRVRRSSQGRAEERMECQTRSQVSQEDG